MKPVRLTSSAWLLLALHSGCADPSGPGEPATDASRSTPDAGDLDAGSGTGAVALDVDAALDATDVDSVANRDAGIATDSGDLAVSDGALMSDAGGSARALVSSTHWTLTTAEQDPFDDRPPSVQCPAYAATPEVLGAEPAFGVDTGFCSYLTAIQPTRSAVAVGETLKVRLWHFDLSAPEPAEAHAALTVDGVVVMDERIAIPAPGGLLVKRVQALRTIPEGAPVYFHLHNHGANSWALVEVSVGP